MDATCDYLGRSGFRSLQQWSFGLSGSWRGAPKQMRGIADAAEDTDQQDQTRRLRKSGPGDLLCQSHRIATAPIAAHPAVAAQIHVAMIVRLACFIMLANPFRVAATKSAAASAAAAWSCLSMNAAPSMRSFSPRLAAAASAWACRADI